MIGRISIDTKNSVIKSPNGTFVACKKLLKNGTSITIICSIIEPKIIIGINRFVLKETL